MKIFFLSKWYDIWPFEESWGHAYRHFGSTAMMSFPWYMATPRDAYERIIKCFQPNLLHIGYYKGDVDLSFRFLEELGASGTKIVAFQNDAVLKPRAAWRGEWQYIEVAPYVDAVYTFSPTHIRTAREAGVEFKLWRPCTDPAIYYPVEIEKDFDLLFLGHARSESSREKLLMRLDREFNLCVGGAFYKELGFYFKHWIKGAFKQDFCTWNCRAKIGLNLVSDIIKDLEEYYSLRLPNIMATKTFAITTYTPGLENIFTRKEHLDWYETEEELVELVHYWLDHDKERERIAQQGYEFVLENLTYRHEVVRVLKDCELV